MFFSTFEEASKRWLVFSSPNDPQIDVTSRWDDPFCDWDDLRVSLPRGAALEETSDRVKGWNFYYGDVSRPLNIHFDVIAITSGIITVLWGMMSTVFKPKPPQNER